MDVILAPIEVVATFTQDGRVLPIRFRVFIPDSGNETIFINQVTRRDRQRLGKTFIDIYTCRGTVQHRERIIELKHEIRSGKWSLYRISP